MPRPTEGDPQAWQRCLAMEANNRAWELAEKARTPAEDREMLDAAHASAWYWGQIGTELNRMRATMLLAEVHAQVGEPRRALAYADEMRAYFLGRETEDWEVAFTHAVTAHCAAKAGDRPRHAAEYAAARDAMEKITDPEDRAIVAKTFTRLPVP